MDAAPACCGADTGAEGSAALAAGDGGAATAAAGGAVEIPSAFAQLLALGLIMITCHCAGMCGPVVLSFRFGLHRQFQRGRVPWALLQLGCYQAGRGLIYAGAGALTGLLAALAATSDWGQAIGLGFATGTRGLILVVAAAFLFLGLRRLWPRRQGAAPVRRPGPLARFGMRSARQLEARPLRASLLLGMVMAMVPCLIPVWVLGLAATTADPLQGALLMLLLVAMTTPALLPFAVLPSLLPRPGRWGPQLQTAALLFSGLWLSLVGLAANDLLPHASTHIGDITIRWW